MAKKKPASIKPGADVARRIWLAGIGAYGRTFSDAQESLAKASGGASKIFEDLVARGEEIEDTVETKGREVVKRIGPAASFSLEDRIKQTRERLGIGEIDAGIGTKVKALEARLEGIDAKLDAILARLEGAAANATPARKRAPKKKTAAKRKSTKT